MGKNSPTSASRSSLTKNWCAWPTEPPKLRKRIRSKREKGSQNMARSRVVIVGAGFGGLAAARALRRAPADVILIDRTNHHVFQPLLYQVATAVLTPGQIATPIRAIVRKQRNATVILGEVIGIDKDTKRVFVTGID